MPPGLTTFWMWMALAGVARTSSRTASRSGRVTPAACNGQRREIGRSIAACTEDVPSGDLNADSHVEIRQPRLCRPAAKAASCPSPAPRERVASDSEPGEGLADDGFLL